MSLFVWADIDEQYAKYTRLKPEDVARLEEWQRKQPHLPPPFHPIDLAHVLTSCCYSNEAAKKCIDAYYTFRTHCPEFFTNRDPFAPEVQLALDTWLMIVLPDRTPEDNVVNYIRMLDHRLDAFDLNTAIKLLDMMMTMVHRQRGCCNGHVFVLDMAGASIGHLLKSPLMTIRKGLMYLQTAVPVHFKSIDIVNTAPFFDTLLRVVRPFLTEKLRDLLHVHYGDNSTIFKCVPREILPIECGGLRFCATDYYKNVIRKEIEKHSEYFNQEEQLLVDESKRPGQPTNLDDLFGVDGTFSQLNVF